MENRCSVCEKDSAGLTLGAFCKEHAIDEVAARVTAFILCLKANGIEEPLRRYIVDNFVTDGVFEECLGYIFLIRLINSIQPSPTPPTPLLG
jgi:hypothetical protein